MCVCVSFFRLHRGEEGRVAASHSPEPDVPDRYRSEWAAPDGSPCVSIQLTLSQQKMRGSVSCGSGWSVVPVSRFNWGLTGVAQYLGSRRVGVALEPWLSSCRAVEAPSRVGFVEVDVFKRSVSLRALL